MAPTPTERSRLRVVLFSGGRGSGALTAQLVNNPRVGLTIVVNGYDDGASTGEVRRFLGDALGPSDFRKNASRVANLVGSCPSDLVDLLDLRLDAGLTERDTGVRIARVVVGDTPDEDPKFAVVRARSEALPAPARADVAKRLERFAEELAVSAKPFGFADCSVGNLVFAGSFLLSGRNFNAAVDDYCGLLGLPAGLIENVTDGTNAHLVALDIHGALLASEEAIVDAKHRNRIREIYVIDRAIEHDDPAFESIGRDEIQAFLDQHAATIRVNPRVVSRLRAADLVIYAPGTQHSSLFPSYLTPGLSHAIATNLNAIKLLVTNIQPDAETVDVSAVDLIDRALFYLRDKGRLTTPAPCLITHYLINDPASAPLEAYVPLGAVESLDDPRLVRIANYEDGVTGRHDATKILAPFIDSLLGPVRRLRVGIYLHDATTVDKLTQTLLEIVRGGAAELPAHITALHLGPPLDADFTASLPFPVRAFPGGAVTPTLASENFDYVLLFESSGMYRGEDIVSLVSQLVFVPLDAVWGSRRLSVNDVREAIRLLYRRKWLLGTVSYFGSHLLSLLYLVFYGRYIYDSLSGVRAIRTRYLSDLRVEPGHKLANHQLLTALLRDRAEILETPVRFFPIGPRQARRTTIMDGVQAAFMIVVRRVWGRPKRLQDHSASVDD